MPKHPVVIGVDIGGTKTKVGAVEVEAAVPRHAVVVSDELSTPRATPKLFYDTIADGVRRIHGRAEREGFCVLPLVAVAHPGRFLPDGTLARGTTPNLGTAPGQFDGVRPAREFEQRLQVNVIAENDAVSQMRFGLALLLCDPAVRPHLVRQTVVYIGPGTGMGGGVAQVSEHGDITPVTDGHLFDMQVPGYGDGMRTTEELLTGPAIARRVAEANEQLASPIHPARAGRLDELLRDAKAPQEHRVVAERIAELEGEILALIIETITVGRIRKVRLEPQPDGTILRHVDEPDRVWSEEDQALVRGAQRFILGGFVGSSPGLGARIRQQALERLRQRDLSTVQIFQIPATSGDAGLLGAVRAIPTHQLSRLIQEQASACKPEASHRR